MSERTKRFAFAILVGIVLNLAFTLFIQIACWGPLISVVVAGYLAKATSPTQGAIMGAFVFLPSSIVIVIQTILERATVAEIGLPLTILAGLIGLLFGVGLGALFGVIVGKFYEYVKDRIIFM